ncbi:MAG: hypothetical protein KC414_12060, partial [Romboutsia sp.]|nr:hypothetical protein [Romboutsia sp.]
VGSGLANVATYLIFEGLCNSKLFSQNNQVMILNHSNTDYNSEYQSKDTAPHQHYTYDPWPVLHKYYTHDPYSFSRGREEVAFRATVY